MNIWDYNKDSMAQYGWTSEDLGLEPGASMRDIVRAAKRLQKKYDLNVDGWVGPITVRRVLLDRDLRAVSVPDSVGTLLINDEIVQVPFKAVAPTEPGGLSLLDNGNYTDRVSGPTQVVWHWDVTLSAARCHSILKRRGYSSHGCIDNDGTFYQFIDMHRHSGWHAGHRRVNRASVGIDVSNAVYVKSQKHYRKLPQGPRPVISAKTNGFMHKRFLGYYPAQIETARDIATWLNVNMDVALATPEFPNIMKNPHKFKGHLAHYHVTKKKWDVAGFPFRYVVGIDDTY